MEQITLNMGFIDNAILCLSFYITWLAVERLLEIVFRAKVNAVLCGVISAGIANTLSDYLGFALQGEFVLANYVAIGCILGMLIIPVCEIIKRLRG